ncbi:methyltransferase [candidate division KSB1 bacterium]|nr:methyltransferase [candidate division KSB1 bacterium]
MTSRKRFQLAMQHIAPDRPPIDIGGTSLTGMRPICQQKLREFLGINDQPQKFNGNVDERILEWACTDFRSVGRIVDLPGPHARKLSETSFVNCWGFQRDVIQGESQIVHYPLKGATYHELKTFRWPEPRVDENLLQAWEQRARQLKAENKYVIIAEHPVYGILELGCWMCGYDDFLFKMAADSDFVRLFFDEVLRIQLEVIRQYYTVLGPYIDLTTSGDDFGMQNSPLISPEMFRRLIAPYFKLRIERTKALAKCLYWHHSCGSVFDLIEQLIECGVDILNPIQTSAAKMQPHHLKAAFGDKIVFWGAVDVQQFLPCASPEQVRSEILSLMNSLGENGGYVIAPAHEMIEDIPPENIVAWVDSMHANTDTSRETN